MRAGGVVMTAPHSVIGTVFCSHLPGGEFASYFGIDPSAVEFPGEGRPHLVVRNFADVLIVFGAVPDEPHRTHLASDSSSPSVDSHPPMVADLPAETRSSAGSRASNGDKTP